MTAIAGRLGEFWAGVDISVAAGPPQVATITDVPQATLTTPGVDPEAVAAQGPVNGALAPARICSSLVDASLSGNVDELETTVHNTDGTYALTTVDHQTARQYIPNFHDETMDLTLRYDEEDQCQRNLMFCAFESKLFWFWYFPDGPGFNAGTAGTRLWMGSSFITSFSPGTPLDDVATLDLSLRLSGTIMVVN